MAIEHTLRFEVVTTERAPAEVYALGEIIYDALTVPKPRDRHVAMVQPNETAAPTTVELFFDVLADTDAELQAAAAATANAMRNFGLETVGDAELRTSREVTPPTVSLVGFTYDDDAEHLTIEASARQQHDIELTIVPRPYGALALITDDELGRRREQAVPVKTITFRRPAGSA